MGEMKTTLQVRGTDRVGQEGRETRCGQGRLMESVPKGEMKTTLRSRREREVGEAQELSLRKAQRDRSRLGEDWCNFPGRSGRPSLRMIWVECSDAARAVNLEPNAGAVLSHTVVVGYCHVHMFANDSSFCMVLVLTMPRERALFCLSDVMYCARSNYHF